MPTRPASAAPIHPDPARFPEFYDAVPTKRALAWLIDVAITVLIAAIVLPFTFFLGILIFPVMIAVVGFVYRWVTISTGSATWGMRFMSVELRDAEGHPLDSGMALFHTGLHYLFAAFAPLLILSAVLMLTSAKRQGLHDMILGTIAINRPM